MKFFWSTSLALLALLSCSENNPGNTTETTNAVSGIIKDKDGKINLVFNPIKMGILLTANKKTFVYDKNVKRHYYNGKKQEPMQLL